MKYHPLAAGVKAALFAGAVGAEIHRFGRDKPADPPPRPLPAEHGLSGGFEETTTIRPEVFDAVREANLVLPRKAARRELMEQYIAQRDTCLKACIEDVLGVELPELGLGEVLEGHQLVEQYEDGTTDEAGRQLYGPTRWLLDDQPLLWISGMRTHDDGREVRGAWTIQLLRNLPDEVLLGLPAGVRRWHPGLPSVG